MENVFAVIKNNLVENTVVADEQRIVELFYPDADLVVLVTEDTLSASTGYEYRNGKFIPFSPFPSWAFNEFTWTWEAPKAKPEVDLGEYAFWDEDSLDWEIGQIPEL